MLGPIKDCTMLITFGSLASKRSEANKPLETVGGITRRGARGNTDTINLASGLLHQKAKALCEARELDPAIIDTLDIHGNMPAIGYAIVREVLSAIGRQRNPKSLSADAGLNSSFQRANEVKERLRKRFQDQQNQPATTTAQVQENVPVNHFATPADSNSKIEPGKNAAKNKKARERKNAKKAAANIQESQ
jgi:hypothetical protein